MVRLYRCAFGLSLHILHSLSQLFTEYGRLALEEGSAGVFQVCVRMCVLAAFVSSPLSLHSLAATSSLLQSFLSPSPAVTLFLDPGLELPV